MKEQDGQIVKVDTRIDTGGLHIQKNFGCNFKPKLLQKKNGTSEKRPRNHWGCFEGP